MKISCITTAFNEGELVRTGVESILRQTHQNIEFIIVDDGADAATRAVLDTFDDDRILLIRQANDGLSAARNKALEQVSGDYVCFLDADDCRPAWALQSIADALARDEPDVLFCRGQLSETDGRLKPFYDDVSFGQLISLASDRPFDRAALPSSDTLPLLQLIEPQVANKVVRTEFLRRERLQFPNGHFFEDILFHTLAVARARHISVLDTLGFTYFRRYRPQTTSNRGEVRLDIISVARLTLELFSLTDGFHDPLYRAAVFASCLKLIRWCGSVVSHQHRHAFNDLTLQMLRALPREFFDPPAEVPQGIEEIPHAWNYLRALGITDNLNRETRVSPESRHDQ